MEDVDRIYADIRETCTASRNTIKSFIRHEYGERIMMLPNGKEIIMGSPDYSNAGYIIENALKNTPYMAGMVLQVEDGKLFQILDVIPMSKRGVICRCFGVRFHENERDFEWMFYDDDEGFKVYSTKPIMPIDRHVYLWITEMQFLTFDGVREKRYAEIELYDEFCHYCKFRNETPTTLSRFVFTIFSMGFKIDDGTIIIHTFD